MSGGTGQWAVAQGGDAGHPVLIRVRTDLDPGTTRARWSHRLVVVWTQQVAMARLEDALTTGLEAQVWGS